MTHPPKTFLIFSLLLFTVFSNETPSTSQPEPDINTFCNQVYENQCSSWLPPHYAHNANCACKALPSTSPEGNCIRNFLVTRLNDDTRYNPDLKGKMSSLKSSETGDEAVYKDLLDKEFLPKIQEDHFDAYKSCGCEGTPAGWWAWEIVTRVSLPSSVIKVGVLFLESCHKKLSKVEASGVRQAEDGVRDRVEDRQLENAVFSEKEIEEERYKEFKVMLEMLGALIFSLIIIYSAIMYCRQRQGVKDEPDFNTSDNEYYKHYNQAILYID